MNDFTLHTLPLQHLLPHPLSANVMPDALKATLAKNIEHTQIVQPLVVRPHPEKKKRYQILDGANRAEALKSLGRTDAQCLVVIVDDPTAELLLATFNSLKGTDNPYRRATLVQRLTEHLPKSTLVDLLPETEQQLDDLLSLLKVNEKQHKKALQKMLDEAKDSLPVHLSFLLASEAAQRVKLALSHFQPDGDPDDSQALLALANFAIDHHHLADVTDNAEEASHE